VPGFVAGIGVAFVAPGSLPGDEEADLVEENVAEA
jgi:hypothetical protein